MLKFLAGSFAVAGLIAASAPIIIHLLNRRRFRVVEWAAMNFLRQAMQRNRRVLQLRDLVVLVLRCLAVALFGAALARPFVSGVSTLAIFAAAVVFLAVVTAFTSAVAGILTSQKKARVMAFGTCAAAVVVSLIGIGAMLSNQDDSTATALTGRQPVHAIVLVDNSQSMGYEALNRTLLDEAKTKAGEFIDALPSDSQIHVIPLCGSDETSALSAYRSKTDARAALDRLGVVDRIGRASHGLDLATQAARQVPELDTKRVVLISDQQQTLWEGGAAKNQLAQLPDVQLVHIPIEKPENVWISKFELQDGVADVETPAVFHVTVEHTGEQPLTNVRVALSIDGEEVASRLVDLEPGQAREVEFKHRMENLADTAGLSEGAGSAAFLKATATATAEGSVGDRQPRDNARHLIAPVVSGLPVVFVDQYGQEENLNRNEVGETYRLRRLLAPRTSTDEEQNRQLVRIRHLTIDRLNEETLSDARLVVIAGVANPGDSVPLLRQYVQQGGSVVIAAGADFDPQNWQQAGWLGGGGILPAPLSFESVGQLPETATQQLETFSLDPKSLQHDFFLIEGETSESLEDLYRSPIFFKAAIADDSDAMKTNLANAERTRLTEAREFLKGSDERRLAWDEKERQGTLTEAELNERKADDDRRREYRPTWLLWAHEDAQTQLDERDIEQLALESRPRVVGYYTKDRHPFLVERSIGAGRVYFVSTGLYSSWNTLTSTNAILVFDRMLRQLLQQTLPQRNYETGDVVTLPAQKSDRARWEVQTPLDRRDPLTIEALSANRYGVRVRRGLWQGHYAVNAIDTSSDAKNVTKTVPLAFNCPPEESQLAAFDALSFRQRMGEGTYRWLEQDDSISVEGAQIRGRDLWKWLIGAVFLFLLAEMLILAWPYRKPEPTAATV